MAMLPFRLSCHPRGQPPIHLHDSDVCPHHENFDPQRWLSAAGPEAIYVWRQRKISMGRTGVRDRFDFGAFQFASILVKIKMMTLCCSRILRSGTAAVLSHCVGMAPTRGAGGR
ncbi:hypothetical protein FIBSPDRAFT_69109 [Athelia psychrophila]|uniref:Uncharacterized protein n=1 Tax=Athelia psychrophila TaxID=1759441 RepID=A0A166TRC6_9AGAM|nr:hypothetical protein FIBSPDRAFT_69109 [Fibularhizoctonia sp. CBS 109695]